MSTRENKVGIISLSQSDLQSAGSVYTTSVAMLDKYRTKHSALLERATEAGEKLPKDLDDELMNWQVSAKKAVKFMNETRSVYTDKAHAFIKEFTALENTLGKELYDCIQQVRDKSAKIHAKEAAAAREKEEAELREKQRRIDAIAELESQLRSGYANHITTVKQTILQVYSNTTLTQIEEAEAAVRGFIGGTLSEEAWNAISLVGDDTLIEEVRTADRFNACSSHFTTEVTKYAEYILTLFPTRKEELERGEQESEQAAELARKQKEEAENARKEAEKRAAEQAEKEKQQATVTVLVSQANREVDAPRAIESYAITIGSVDGWRAVVDYYLTNAGASTEELGKVKLDSMVTFAERQAKSTGEMITHSDVSYEPKYKAVARATKKKAA